ncbi:glycosyltransferase [Kingella negevensis]|uniref:glycosyltransferase n=1 Tax=Kingella negevensis TaxID=1522312 RepID=UPI0015C4FCBA|nr:glycosyltransferase [Kingella negevensis]WII90270.1 glycosyltransferase [Kingella negevensis]
MNISQIFISDEPISELPTALDTAVKSVKSVLANVAHTQHTIYLKEPLRAWINQEYGAEMLKAFDKLKPFAYQADLARYLLLYRLGGWYFDIAIRVVSPTTNIPDDIDFIAFSDLSECAVKLRRLRRKYQARTAKQSNQC